MPSERDKLFTRISRVFNQEAEHQKLEQGVRRARARRPKIGEMTVREGHGGNWD
jgi:hypothetical protein